jgi:hypothetical protein
MRHGHDHKAWQWLRDVADVLLCRRDLRQTVEWLMTELRDTATERDEANRAALLAERQLGPARDNVNARLYDEIRRLRAEINALRLDREAPYTSWDEPVTRPYVPLSSVPRESPGVEELTDAEAAVTPCGHCSQPHGVGESCAGEIEEAA